jgi:hypothetical protein
MTVWRWLWLQQRAPSLLMRCSVRFLTRFYFIFGHIKQFLQRTSLFMKNLLLSCDTRSDQQISRQIFKNLFSKFVTIEYDHLRSSLLPHVHSAARIFHDWKHAWKSFSEIPFREIAVLLLISSKSSKCSTFLRVIDLGEQKEVAGGKIRQVGWMIFSTFVQSLNSSGPFWHTLF